MIFKRAYLILCVSIIGAFGLEFGTMGQVSAGIGGAGVALKQSAWGLYYNPALLGADNRTKFGYSFGVNVKEQNLAEIVNIDTNNLKNFPTTLSDELTKATSGGVSVSLSQGTGSTAVTIDGAFGGMLNSLFGKDKISDSDMGSLIKSIDSSQTCSSFNDCATAISSNQTLAQRFKDKVLAAANESGSSLVANVIGGINSSDLGNVFKVLSDGSKTESIGEKILTNLTSGISIAKGTDETIDKILQDFAVINKALQSNDINIISQNGLVFQIGSNREKRTVESDAVGEIVIEEERSGRGAVGIGIFASAFANASAQIDANNNKLIFDLGGKYYQASVSGDNITLSYLQSQSNLTGSIMNSQANHRLYTSALSIIEVPVGYGHTFFTGIGDFHLGFAAKFMQAFSYGFDERFSVGEMPNIQMPSMSEIVMSQTFGIDLGFIYTPSFASNFNIGIVGKNLNVPVVRLTSNENIKLNPQVRAGLSYTAGNFLTLAADIDVLPNNTLSLTSPKSQFVGGGVLMDFTYIDIRLGAMKDLRSNAGEGIILTGGLNLFGFLDVAMQYGLGNDIQIAGMKLSNYMTVRVGGQFSF